MSQIAYSTNHIFSTPAWCEEGFSICYRLYTLDDDLTGYLLMTSLIILWWRHWSSVDDVTTGQLIASSSDVINILMTSLLESNWMARTEVENFALSGLHVPHLVPTVVVPSVATRVVLMVMNYRCCRHHFMQDAISQCGHPPAILNWHQYMRLVA